MSHGQRTILINRVGRRLHVLAPLGAKELIKSIPGRRWDHRARLWTLPSDVEDEARDILDGWPGGASWEGDAPARAAHNRAASSGPGKAGRLTTERCNVCRERLDPALVAEGAVTHPGCEAGR